MESRGCCFHPFDLQIWWNVQILQRNFSWPAFTAMIQLDACQRAVWSGGKSEESDGFTCLACTPVWTYSFLGPTHLPKQRLLLSSFWFADLMERTDPSEKFQLASIHCNDSTRRLPKSRLEWRKIRRVRRVYMVCHWQQRRQCVATRVYRQYMDVCLCTCGYVT